MGRTMNLLQLNLAVSLYTAGALGLLLVGLAARVSQLRFQHKISYGDGGNPALLRAIRVHGNTAEHAPLFILLVLVFELGRGNQTFAAIVASAFVVSRLMFAVGVLARGLNILRVAGAALTYALQLLMAIAVLGLALSR